MGAGGAVGAVVDVDVDVDAATCSVGWIPAVKAPQSRLR